MQGRQGQGNDPWNRSSSGPHVEANGTGKQRALPQRPPGMTRIERPPQTPRVNRPQRQAQPPKSWRRRLLILPTPSSANHHPLLTAKTVGLGAWSTIKDVGTPVSPAWINLNCIGLRMPIRRPSQRSAIHPTQLGVLPSRRRVAPFRAATDAAVPRTLLVLATELFD